MADTRRHRVGDAPRTASGREWEVFLRERAGAPLSHAGSVTAPDEGTAHDRAVTLFDGAAADVWLCPAGEVRRFVSRSVERGDG